MSLKFKPLIVIKTIQRLADDWKVEFARAWIAGEVTLTRTCNKTK
jgi:hypothetical protein